MGKNIGKKTGKNCKNGQAFHTKKPVYIFYFKNIPYPYENHFPQDVDAFLWKIDEFCV